MWPCDGHRRVKLITVFLYRGVTSPPTRPRRPIRHSDRVHPNRHGKSCARIPKLFTCPTGTGCRMAADRSSAEIPDRQSHTPGGRKKQLPRESREKTCVLRQGGPVSDPAACSAQDKTAKKTCVLRLGVTGERSGRMQCSRQNREKTCPAAMCPEQPASQTHAQRPNGRGAYGHGHQTPCVKVNDRKNTKPHKRF